MKHIRIYFICTLYVWSLMSMAQKADFEVQNFHENMTDLSAATSDIRDLNGLPAALIRFSVRDSNFTINANNGILKQEQKKGETWVYVPVGTKRLNITHPVLGIIRSYQIETLIKPKCTYDADIVITNKSYMASLITNGRVAFTEQDRPKDIIPNTPSDEIESKRTNSDTNYKKRKEVKKKDDKVKAYKLVRHSDDMYFIKIKGKELEMYNDTNSRHEKKKKSRNKEGKKQSISNEVKKNDVSYNSETFTINSVRTGVISDCV